MRVPARYRPVIGPATLVVTPMALAAKKSMTCLATSVLVRPIAVIRPKVSTASGKSLIESIRALASARRPAAQAAGGHRQHHEGELVAELARQRLVQVAEVDRDHRGEVLRVAATVAT